VDFHLALQAQGYPPLYLARQLYPCLPFSLYPIQLF
jgi:hypothetical protein